MTYNLIVHKIVTDKLNKMEKINNKTLFKQVCRNKLCVYNVSNVCKNRAIDDKCIGYKPK